MDNFSPEGDVPPPPPSNPLPVSAPSTGGVGLGQGKLGESDEKTMGMLAHILGAFTSFVGPLIIWLIKKDESPFVNDQGKEALNFQITLAGAYVVCMIGQVLGTMVFAPIGCIFWLAMVAAGVAGLVFAILGGLEANKGKAYRYPFALRLIS